MLGAVCITSNATSGATRGATRVTRASMIMR
jgi:hypothetical protein